MSLKKSAVVELACASVNQEAPSMLGDRLIDAGEFSDNQRPDNSAPLEELLRSLNVSAIAEAA
jgi:hypothetical protein